MDRSFQGANTLKKPILILALSASFIAGTMVAGNFVFADPEDGQNNLLQMILNKLNKTVDDAVFVSGSLKVQSFTCPDSTEISDSIDPVPLAYNEDDANPVAHPFFMQKELSSVSLGMGWGNGDITQNNFLLTGVIDQDGFCGDITIPSAVTISGDCGLGETATLTSEEGLSITFTGNIVCG